MNLDDRISQLVREAVEPMLAQRFEHLEQRVLETVEKAVARDAGSPGPEQLLKSADVAEIIQVSPRTVQRLAAEGDFPSPIRVSPGRLRWRQGDVDAWLESRR